MADTGDRNLDFARNRRPCSATCTSRARPTARCSKWLGLGPPGNRGSHVDRIATVFTSLVPQKLGKQPRSGQTPPPAITATVFDPAHASSKPMSPRPVRTMVIDSVLGLALRRHSRSAARLAPRYGTRGRRTNSFEPDERETLPEQIPQGPRLGNAAERVVQAPTVRYMRSSKAVLRLRYESPRIALPAPFAFHDASWRNRGARSPNAVRATVRD